MFRTDSGLLNLSSFFATLVAAAGVLLPSIDTDSFRFGFIDEGLTISISRNSPPRAVLEDEALQALVLSPPEAIELKPGQVLLQAGDALADIRVSELQIKNPTPVMQPGFTPSMQINSVTMRVVANDTRATSITHGDRMPDFGETLKEDARPMPDVTPAGSPSNPDDLFRDIITAQKSTPPMFRRIAQNSLPPAAPPNLPTLPTFPMMPKETSVHAMSTMEGKTQSEPVLVHGTIELAKGLAFTQGSTLSVHHEISGTIFARGDVQIQQAKYQILVSTPKSGALVAELRDANGTLQGLAQVENFKQNQNLQLLPVPLTLTGVVRSVYGPALASAEVEIHEVQQRETTDAQGQFFRAGFLPTSQVMLKSNKMGHWGSLVVSDTTRPIQVEMFPEKMITALQDLSGASQSGGAIIWGKIQSDDQPVAGAQVETTAENALGPIYFNSMQIPDRTQPFTSANGLFAFLRVPAGLHVIRAHSNGKVIPSRVVIAEQNYVSKIELQGSESRIAQTLIYDAMTGEPLSSTLDFAGSEKTVAVTGGRIAVRYNTGHDLMFLEADSGAEYYPERQTLSRDVGYINFPMVKRLWLESTINSARINLQPDASMVVGFVQGSDFTVALPEKLSACDVIYFDSQGSRTANGIDGGGFVVVNAPVGMHSVGILPNNKSGAVTRVFYSTNSATNIMNVRF